MSAQLPLRRVLLFVYCDFSVTQYRVATIYNRNTMIRIDSTPYLTLSGFGKLFRQHRLITSSKPLHSLNAYRRLMASVCVILKKSQRIHRVAFPFQDPSIFVRTIRLSCILCLSRACTARHFEQRTPTAISCWPSIWTGRLVGTSGTWSSQHSLTHSYRHSLFALFFFLCVERDISLTEAYWDPEDYMHAGMHTHTLRNTQR